VRTIVAVGDWDSPPTMDALAKRYLDPNAKMITERRLDFAV